MGEMLRARLSPFRHRYFRNYFLAQTLSLVGTWSHDLARAWIIVEATGSSGALGNLNTAIAVPCLFLILQAGALVDRTDVRRLIFWTKSLMALSSLVLAALTEFGSLQVWHFLIFGVIEGCIIAFDSPAFQTLTVRLVPRGEFQQAIALNSTNFHTSRMLGPIIATWLMSFYGPSLVFLFDSITYVLVAVVLHNIKMPAQPKLSASQSTNLKDGLRYIFRHPQLRYRVMQLMLTIGCVFPLMVSVFRVFVQQKFLLDAHEFGTVFSVTALGSMFGALTFAVIKPNRPIRALLLGVPLVFTMLMIAPWLPTLPLTVVAMSLTGYGLYLTFASLTVSMQLDVDEAYRGRLSAVIGLGFSSLGPLMSFPWGHMADYIGAPQTIVAAATIFGMGSAVLALANPSGEVVREDP
jgi:MFS family permease